MLCHCTSTGIDSMPPIRGEPLQWIFFSVPHEALQINIWADGRFYTLDEACQLDYFGQGTRSLVLKCAMKGRFPSCRSCSDIQHEPASFLSWNPTCRLLMTCLCDRNSDVQQNFNCSGLLGASSSVARYHNEWRLRCTNETSANKRGAHFSCNGLLEDRLCMLSPHDGSRSYCSPQLSTGLFSLHSPDLKPRMKLTASKLSGEVPAALHAYDGLGTVSEHFPASNTFIHTSLWQTPASHWTARIFY